MGSVRFREVSQDDTIVIEEIHKVVVHKFTVSDVDDPEIYAAGPIWNWQQSDPGKFVMQHAIGKPSWAMRISYAAYGYEYIITAELESKKLSEFYLRWGKDGSGKIR